MLTGILLVMLTVGLFFFSVIFFMTGLLLIFFRRLKLSLIIFAISFVMALSGVSSGVFIMYKSFKTVKGWIQSFASERTGMEIFSATVMEKVPSSVKILHSQDDSIPLGFDPIYWLHFSIIPKDFEKVLAQHPYARLDKGDDMSLCNPPDWWNPKLLSNVEYYRYDRNHPGSNVLWESTIIWVNSEHTEVYFCLVYF